MKLAKRLWIEAFLLEFCEESPIDLLRPQPLNLYTGVMVLERFNRVCYQCYATCFYPFLKSGEWRIGGWAGTGSFRYHRFTNLIALWRTEEHTTFWAPRHCRGLALARWLVPNNDLLLELCFIWALVLEDIYCPNLLLMNLGLQHRKGPSFCIRDYFLRWKTIQ